MARVRHLRRAPVTEALIDLRATLPEGFDPLVFDPLPGELRARLPIVEKRQGLTAHIDLERGKATSGDVQLHGLHFRSEDGLELAQFRRDGFTLNRLHPYTSFDQLLPLALDLWKHYTTKAEVETVERTAVRFINHIRLAVTADLSEYLVRPPTPPPGGLPSVARFLEKYVVLDPQAEIAANFTRSLEGPDDNKISILIDVDVYKRGRVASERTTLEPLLMQLRKVKNDMFFGSITENTAEIYE